MICPAAVWPQVNRPARHKSAKGNTPKSNENMLSEGNVMYYLRDWQEAKMSSGKSSLSSEALSRLFAGIDSKHRVAFLNDWIKKRKSQEFLAYDVTSISSYSKGLLNAEWGYNRYFFINRSKDGKLAFRRNPDAIDKVLVQCGFFLIAETDFKKTTAESLEICRRRDVVEKSFDDLKNDLDMRRLYVHSDEIAEGKAFVAFLALIVRSRMQNLLQPYMTEEHFTFRKVLLELDKARLVLSADRLNGCRLLNPPTKTQKDIFSALTLSLDLLSDCAFVC